MTSSNSRILTIRRPDDWHVHLRDGEILKTVLPYTSKYFARAVIMPNLNPRIITIKQAVKYREQILTALPKNHDFKPLMTCYLISSMQKKTLINGFTQGVFTAAKFYPNDKDHLYNDIKHDIIKMYPLFEVMQNIGMPLLIHGEVNNKNIDIFDREAYFIELVINSIHNHFPVLKIVLEHISTKESVDYVLNSNNYIGATITPQHLIYNRNHLLSEGIKPHLYCAPILKKELHRKALCAAIKKGCNRLFLGTDSAPHLCSQKESSNGNAGIFNAPVALQSYAMIFEKIGALANFESFCSLNGPRFYNLPLNNNVITLKKEHTNQSNIILSNKKILIPFLSGQLISWKVVI